MDPRREAMDNACERRIRLSFESRIRWGYIGSPRQFGFTLDGTFIEAEALKALLGIEGCLSCATAQPCIHSATRASASCRGDYSPLGEIILQDRARVLAWLASHPATS